MSVENKIWPIPPLPEEIKEAVNNDKLAVFIGAGVSRIIGCIGWDQLAARLVNKCYSSHLISFKEKDTLLKNEDHKKLISICQQILKKNGLEDVFLQELRDSLEPDPKLVSERNVYEELWGLHGLFVTTNIDLHFDSKFPLRIVYKIEDFDPSRIDRTKLYHIHGTISDPSSIVLTVSQYFDRYHDEQFRLFLKRIFADYVVLFVGYGVNEFELLDFLIQKYDPNKRKMLKHFLLKGFYAGESNILEYEQSYYNQMGIQVLPFEMDRNGHGQIYDVIKSWSKEIFATSTYLHDTFDKIDQAIDNYTKPEAQAILQIVKNDKSQEGYFLKKLASTNKPSPWLSDLASSGYFDPANNPSPIDTPDKKGFTISGWKILPYLENLTVRNSTNPDTEITKAIVEIVNSIIRFREAGGTRIENSFTDSSLVRIISKLPLNEITQEHIKFIGSSLESRHEIELVPGDIIDHLLPKLTDGEAKDLLLALLLVMFSYRKYQQYGLTRYTSLMGDYWLGEALKRHKSKIAHLCGLSASDQAIEIMRKISDADPHSFLVISSIEDTDEHFQHDYLYQLVSFAGDMYELAEPGPSEDRIKRLLNEKHAIFRRIGLHVIGKRYGQLGNLVWRYASNPLDDLYSKLELYELLRSNCFVFSQHEIDKVLGWIESADYHVPLAVKEQNREEQFLAYRKKEWLHSLLDSKNEKVKALYDKYEKANPTPLDHPGHLVWIATEFGPVTRVADPLFQNRTNSEIAEYLKEAIRDEEKQELLAHQVSDRFRDAVSEDPVTFSTNLQPFLKIPIIYQYSLLLGLSEAWRKNKVFPWNELFDFMYEIVNSEDFWKQANAGRSSTNPDWIASEIASMIEGGTRDDKHAFAKELLPKACSILLILASKTSSTAEDGPELIMSVLNSPRGKTFSAMMQVSLRIARTSQMPSESKWIESIKQDFTSRLNRTFEKSLDFSVVLGQYYPHLTYLDEKWAQTNVNSVFSKEDTIHWKVAFSGYLFYASSIHKAVYHLLRLNEHYAMALNTDFADGKVATRLVQHICIGYLRGFENLEDETGLVARLLRKANLLQLSEIVGFFWLLRDELTDDMRIKVKPLWRELYHILAAKKDDPAYREVMANTSKWLSLIQDIDGETLEWLMLSAKCFRADYETAFFVEYLAQHSAKWPKEVGKLYLQMLDSGIYPQYQVDHIQETVRTIYAFDKETADRICNAYGAKGIEFLRQIYDQHRKEHQQE